jgi:hypothetical protein
MTEKDLSSRKQRTMGSDFARRLPEVMWMWSGRRGGNVGLSLAASPLVFFDGFESGDTSMCSSTTPHRAGSEAASTGVSHLSFTTYWN